MWSCRRSLSAERGRWRRRIGCDDGSEGGLFLVGFELIEVIIEGEHPLDFVIAIVVEVDFLAFRDVGIRVESHEIHATTENNIHLAIRHRSAIVVHESHLVSVPETIHIRFAVHHKQVTYPLWSEQKEYYNNIF